MIYLIDSGHGGMIDNIYQTYPNKMFTYDSGEIVYEGVINRLVKDFLLDDLRHRGVKFVDICPSELDLELDYRVDTANLLCREYGKENCLLISLHSNAGGGTGFEIWTSLGQTESDKYASMLVSEFEHTFPDIKIRRDRTDGDADKEAQFYILKWSKCAAILPEFLFFDNWDDYQKIVNPVYQKKYAEAIANFINRVESKTF